MIIKVFISHAEKDIKLAKILKEKLEATRKIKAFMYEHVDRYDVGIVKKLTDEIEESDYLIAIIAGMSASVHQEIGYAKGVGINIIPLIKKDVDKGFLIHGAGIKEFTDDNFEEKYTNVIKNIIDNGLQLKYDMKLIKKGAHYRDEINHSVIDFLFSVIKIFDIKDVQITKINRHGRTMEDKSIIQTIIMNYFCLKERNEIIDSYKIDSKLWNKLAMCSKKFQERIEKAKIYQHINLPQKELELIGKIQHNISIKTWSKNLNKKEQNFFIILGIEKMQDLLEFMTQLVDLHIEYEVLFKKNAFKTMYD